MLKKHKITYSFRMNEKSSSFELMHENECVGFVRYDIKDEVYVLNSAEVKPEYELKEAETYLAEFLFSYMEDNKFKMIIYSRTLLAFIRRNKKWHYLVQQQ